MAREPSNEPDTREALVGTGGIEERADYFPAPKAELTPSAEIMTGPGPYMAAEPTASGSAGTDGGASEGE